MCLFLAVLGLHYCEGFSLVSESWDYSLLRSEGFSLQCKGLLQTMGSRSTWASAGAAPGLQGTGPGVVAPGLSCSLACGIFPDQGLNFCTGLWIPYHWATREALTQDWKSTVLQEKLIKILKIYTPLIILLSSLKITMGSFRFTK